MTDILLKALKEAQEAIHSEYCSEKHHGECLRVTTALEEFEKTKGWRPISEHDGSQTPVLIFCKGATYPTSSHWDGKGWLINEFSDWYYEDVLCFQSLPKAPEGEKS